MLSPPFLPFAFGRTADYAVMAAIGWLHAKRMDQTARIFLYQRGRRSVSRNRLFTAGREHVCEDAQGNQLQTNGGQFNLQFTGRGLIQATPLSCEMPRVFLTVQNWLWLLDAHL
jgi:hypothetical protein